MATPTVYVICDNNCKYEGMTREQILTAITQAVNNGTIGNIDTGFITTVKTITGTPLKFFVGTQNEYDALTDTQKENLFAIISNDTTKEGILASIATLEAKTDDLENWLTVETNALKNRVTRLESRKTLEWRGNFSIDIGYGYPMDLPEACANQRCELVFEYQDGIYLVTTILKVGMELAAAYNSFFGIRFTTFYQGSTPRININIDKSTANKTGTVTLKEIWVINE